jgi:membrane associated rhomboid family serine protease
MQPKMHAHRKRIEGNPPQRDTSRHLLTVRSALIFLLAAVCAGVGAVCLLDAHSSIPIVIYSGFGILGAAILFWDKVIEP